MGLSTKNIKVSSGSGLPKTISPGKAKVKIHKIVLDQMPWMVQDKGYFLKLHVETEAIEGFEGFFIDKEDESKGRYHGQVGQISTNRYFYKDGVTKSGTVIERDNEILAEVKSLCAAADNEEWFAEADGKFDTIEEFIEGFNKSSVLKDKLFSVCVAGKEYQTQGGHIGYNLFFPKKSGSLVAIELADSPVSALIQYNEEKHLIKLAAAKPVESFGGTDSTTSSDFSGVPEFEL